MDLVKGGRGAIERMVEAYGFSTRQALCEQLGVSKSTLATRYMRDSFPSDWVIQCVIETGVSLLWLTTGEGKMYSDVSNEIQEVSCKKLIDGRLLDSNFYIFDKAFLPRNVTKPIAVIQDKTVFLVNHGFNEVHDGLWLVNIESRITIKEIARIPGGKIRINNGALTFDCDINDIELIGKIVATYNNL